MQEILFEVKRYCLLYNHSFKNIVKILKIRTLKTFAVIILKLEQYPFITE